MSRGCSPTPLVASASVDHLSVDELLRSLDIPSLSASQVSHSGVSAATAASGLMEQLCTKDTWALMSRVNLVLLRVSEPDLVL